MSVVDDVLLGVCFFTASLSSTRMGTLQRHLLRIPSWLSCRCYCYWIMLLVLLLFSSFLSSSASPAQAFVHPGRGSYHTPSRCCSESSHQERRQRRRGRRGIPPLPFHYPLFLSSEASSSSSSSSSFEEQPEPQLDPQPLSRTEVHHHATTDENENENDTTLSSDETVTTSRTLKKIATTSATSTTTTMWNKDALYLERYKRRKQRLRSNTLAHHAHHAHHHANHPPHPDLTPLQVVQQLLEGLGSTSLHHVPSSLPYKYKYKYKYWGVHQLWESSTRSWQEILGRSIGRNQSQVDDYNNNHNYKYDKSLLTTIQQQQQQQQQQMMMMIPSLHRALVRPHQQFAILSEYPSSGMYWVEYPTDVLEFHDECWIECRLRSYPENQLLVVMGWTLVKQQPQQSQQQPQSQSSSRVATDDNHHGDDSCCSCWYLQSLDWQDFRDEYRPGMGREEWERICG